MAYEGWFRFGGNEVVNNERARGIASTVECPMFWLKGPRCTTLQDALGDPEYNAANLPDAPWFDPSMPDVSSRFFGVFALSVTGLNDSTRGASVVEGIDDGATIGRTRKSARQVRVRAMLLSRGRDALDYGVSWLNAALDPDACGQHGTGCGTTDLEYLTDCPPARGEVGDFTPWSEPVTNLFTNPDFAAGEGTVEVRRNLWTDPVQAETAMPNLGARWAATNGTQPQPVIEEDGWVRLTAAAVTVDDTISRASNWGANGLPVSPSTTYTLSFEMERKAGLPVPKIDRYEYTAAGAGVGGRVTGGVLTQDAATGRWFYTFTTAATVERVVILLMNAAAIKGVQAGDWWRLRQTQLVASPVLTPYGDPTNGSVDPDLTASWTGAANNSLSILSGTPVAGVASIADRCLAIWSTKYGGSMRLIAARSSSDTFVAAPVPSPAWGGGVIIGTRHQESVLPNPIDRALWTSLPAQWVPFANEVGSAEYRLNFSELTADRSFRFYHGGPQGSGDVYWTNAALVAGAYDGPAFSGDTESTDLARYAWLGAADASVSTRETREAFVRPRTDEEYAALVDPYRRFLHNVSVTSGPLERELMNKGEFWGQIFEWTYTAGRPWVYSATRAVDLPITPTIVIQDTPFNLVPYPSAELSGGDVDAAYNFSANPSVETNATGWATAVGAPVTAGMVTSGRVTGELAAVGTSSFRAVATLSGSGTDGFFGIQQVVDLSARPAGSRVSINFWAAELLMSGAPTRQPIEFYAYWTATSGGAILRSDLLGSVPVDGGAVSAKSIVPPAGANFVTVRAQARLSWTAAAVVRLYADALAVTVP